MLLGNASPVAFILTESVAQAESIRPKITTKVKQVDLNRNNRFTLKFMAYSLVKICDIPNLAIAKTVAKNFRK